MDISMGASCGYELLVAGFRGRDLRAYLKLKIHLPTCFSDYTLWPFWIDTHVDGPFQKNSQGVIRDRSGKVVEVYRDVLQIFQHLRSLNITIGVASRTGDIKNAHDLVDLLGWKEYISFREIYPGSKIPHFQNFRRNTGISFADMVFFDDEKRNIRDVSKLGVTCIHAAKGMSLQVLHQGLQEFARNRGQSS